MGSILCLLRRMMKNAKSALRDRVVSSPDSPWTVCRLCKDSQWTPNGFHGLSKDSVDSPWTVHGQWKDSVDFHRTLNGLPPDPWASVTYRSFHLSRMTPHYSLRMNSLNHPLSLLTKKMNTSSTISWTNVNVDMGFNTSFNGPVMVLRMIIGSHHRH
jgi:hypothetical protein